MSVGDCGRQQRNRDNRQSTAANAALPIPNSFLEIIMICLSYPSPRLPRG